MVFNIFETSQTLEGKTGLSKVIVNEVINSISTFGFLTKNFCTDFFICNDLFLENTFRNSSFVFLFLAMVYFWIQFAFYFSPSNSNLKSLTSTFSTSQNNIETSFNKSFSIVNIFTEFGNILILLANVALFLLLVLRWKSSGHFPLSNLYESLMFLSWNCTLLHFILLKMFIINPTVNSSSAIDVSKVYASKVNAEQKIIGSITTPTALLLNAYATFSLPSEMQKVAPLVPALQSNWLMMHVTVMILSYAALILGSLFSVVYLIISSQNYIYRKPLANEAPSMHFVHRAPSRYTQTLSGNINTQIGKTEVLQAQPTLDVTLVSTPFTSTVDSTILSSLSTEAYNLSLEGINTQTFVADYSRQELESEGSILNLSEKKQQKETENPKNLVFQSVKNLGENLENYSYRLIGIGFSFLTIGILSGAVWANEAWGSYWSWDPKETWAFLTWLIYAIYLHTRITKGWEGKKPAILASVGFISVWICFLGVNLIGEGLHSYGWFNKTINL